MTHDIHRRTDGRTDEQRVFVRDMGRVRDYFVDRGLTAGDIPAAFVYVSRC